MRERLKTLILIQAGLPLEAAILLIAGLMVLLAGILLFPVAAGSLPYYENGLYGLLLFIFALQILTLGKTPFGDMRRSMPLIGVGITIAGVGIVTCFIPDLLSQIPRILLFVCFAPGGLLLLLQMVFSREKLRAWIRYGGLFRHLVFGCGTVYLLSFVIGWLVLIPTLLDITATAVIALIFGIAILYLALVLRKIYLTYPQAERADPGTSTLSTDKMLLLVIGIFMLLLGVLLIPVSFGQLPFAGSAQLGLLMVIFAVQMLASGSTPIGVFPRSWLVILLGLIFAALGIVSGIVPGYLVPLLTVLIGLLNVTNGMITLGKILLPLFVKRKTPRPPAHPVLQKLSITQFTLGVLSVLFGSSMLMPNLIPGPIVGVVLTANGVVLLYLITVLMALDQLISQQTEKSDT